MAGSTLSVDVERRFPRGPTIGATFEMDLAAGEALVLFGPSGAGKSLTLQMIAGLARPDEGSIRLNDRTLYDSSAPIDRPSQERNVGYVFQDLALFPHMTVEENIRFGGHGIAADVRRERTAAMIERFRLGGLERKHPGGISGGQKQRVAFARALIRKPDALLLDEPFSALDAPLREEMGGMLREVQRELRIPVVLVTHDRAEAIALGDRLIVYAEGRVSRDGQPETLLADPAAAAETVRPMRDRQGTLTASLVS